MTIVYIFVFFASFIAYLQKRFFVFLVLVLGLMSKLFMLDTTPTESIIVRGEDLTMFLLIGLLPFVYLRNKKVFTVNNDPLTRWVYIFLGLYLIELLLTVLMGRESLFNSLKVIRVSFLMLAFFVFKTIPVETYKKFLKIALWITIIQGILFVLQFVGIRWLSGNLYDQLVLGDSSATAINTPTLLFFFIFFVLIANYLKKRRALLFVFLIGVLFLSFVRGRIIAIILGLAYFAFIGTPKKYRLSIILAFVLIIPIAYRVFDSKSETRGSSGIDEIGYVLSHGSDLSNIDSKNGTFAFRIAMLTERVVWLADNRKYLLTGVGTMHEDSPKTLQMFNFNIGTNNEERAYGHTIIDSGDITWAPIALRYGLIGLFVHLMMFIALFNATRKRTDVLVLLASLMISMFVLSIDGALFERAIYIYQFAIFYAMVSRSNYENKLLIM